MATKNTPAASPTQQAALAAKRPAPRDREAVFADLCTLLEQGLSLTESCKAIPDAPTPAGVLGWIYKDPDGLGKRYALARETGYSLLGDEITRIAGETHAIVHVQKTDADGKPLRDAAGEPLTEKVLAPLSADVMAHKRLVVDTLKWKLARMLPKMYGDKVTTEHTGPGGGPVQIAALDLKNLSDAELAQMQEMLSRAGGGAV